MSKKLISLMLIPLVAMVCSPLYFIHTAKPIRADENIANYAANNTLNLPKPDYVKVTGGTQGIYAWSYANSVSIKNTIDTSGGPDASISFALGPLSISTSGLKTNFYNHIKIVTDEGFGLVERFDLPLGSAPVETDYYCNDSWPTQAAAVDVSKAPQKCDRTHVTHYGNLGAIPNAFYGGWSCDYAGTADGAPWAGVGKGHK